MVQRNSGIQEPDVIIVGGGHASADFIPDLCDALGERIRGVVFIDHDMGEITGLESIINGRNIDFSYVRLEKRGLERDLFNDYVKTMGLEGYAEWDDDLTNHPPMLRVQTRLRQRDIFDAVWNLLPTQRGRLVSPRVNIVFAFGMTGMTSSTVALEAGTTIRRTINEQIANSRVGVQSNIDAPPASRHWLVSTGPVRGRRGL